MRNIFTFSHYLFQSNLILFLFINLIYCFVFTFQYQNLVQVQIEFFYNLPNSLLNKQEIVQFFEQTRIKMKTRENPFRMSALNSLKVHQVQIKDQKQLNNTFKGGNDLRSQLTKPKKVQQTKYSMTMQGLNSNKTKEFSSTMISKQKPQSQSLMDQVAALDNFKLPVTREKTKNMIENIKLRRRQQHIQAYNNFKEDLEDYKDNLQQIYESLYNDCQQVLSIKQQQMLGFLNAQSDEYLLGREKELLDEIQTELFSYQTSSKQKLSQTFQELQRIRTSRGTVVQQTCEILRFKLIDIAFVLEDEARQIQSKEKQEISELQEKFYFKYKDSIRELSESQQQKNTMMREKTDNVIKRWREIKQNYEITTFQQAINSEPYINSKSRQRLYGQLIALQEQNHKRKKQCLQSLILQQHVDSLRKVNIQKWQQLVKSVNDQFDAKLDDLVKRLMEEYQQSKDKHQQLIEHIENRLKYIQNHNQQEINQMIQDKFKLMVEKNNNTAQQLMKQATSYAQLNDQKQNTLLQNLYQFFLNISQTNDDFAKDFSSLNQKHQLEKAKILDDDQQLVQKLNNQLQQLKKQLRESLHHLKLEDIQKKCFQKIDQIEAAYRKTHQNNKTLTAARPAIIEKFMQSFQAKIAFIFQLYEQTKRNELIQRNKQDAEKQALKRIEEEDKKKQQEEQKQLQLIKKNGGKVPPAPKPKDPKKLAAQIEERKKAILNQMGQKKIQQIKTGSGNTWLVYKSLQEIASDFYKPSKEEGEKKEQNPQINSHNQSSTENVLPADKLPQPIKNTVGQSITTNTTLLTIAQVSSLLLTLRDKVFENISSKKERISNEASIHDEDLMQESLTMLDDRLKRHYSLKGQLQAEIFIKRSGEITNHKKRYEKYARTVRQKMDLQTERFNYLLEKGLNNLKTHNQAQKQLRQKLPQGKNLSQLQGILSRARQNSNKFTQQLNQIVAQLNHLSKIEVEILLQKNKDFIKQSKLMKDGGEYSEEEIKWYEEMMNQITLQLKTQQSKRQQKAKEINQQCEKRRKQLLQKIQKQYSVQIQDLSAKQGTGKVYGKPKRTAQQKIRLQMNKCQQAQLSITKQLQTLIQIYQKENSQGFKAQARPETLKWRKQLMTLFTCIQRYAKHIEALKKDIKVRPIVRVNYDESLAQSTVTSVQQDKKLIEEELKHLGPLGEQKQDKPFSKFVLDIQKIISDESRTIYVGDKAKYLTGADKLPDFLRKYIQQMKQSAEDFRQNSVRQLRQSCIRLNEFVAEIGTLFFYKIGNYFLKQNDKSYHKILRQFQEYIQRQDRERAQNLRLLRPNLANPKCQDQLKELNQKELSRQSQFTKSISNIREEFKSAHFSNGSTFLSCLINNYQFLIQYADSLYLFEDFIKVNGDDELNKPKLNIKKLIVMKQKGLSIDSSSQRNLSKKWQGIDFTIINFDDKKFTYKKAQVQEPATKDNKKGAKKQAKKPGNEIPVQNENVTVSKEIETYKTWRQKSIYEERQKCLQQFRSKYTSTVAEMYSKIQQSMKDSDMFTKKWVKIVSQLEIK